MDSLPGKFSLPLSPPTSIRTNPHLKTQALWLQQAYQLEYHGRSTFVPGLWGAGLVFFMVNVWILGVVVGDVGRLGRGRGKEVGVEKGEEGGGKNGN